MIDADPRATYMAVRDPARSFTTYYPKWIDNLADDATLEGSLMDGVVQGPEAIRTVLAGIRALYEHQQFNYAGPCADISWVEDYVAHVGGQPIACVVLVTNNSEGQTQHIAANYRPRSSLLLFSRLMAERLAGTPYAEHFATGES